MPFFMGHVLELPLTASQDYTVFHILGQHSTRLWKEQIDRVAAGGLCWSHCQHDWTSTLYDEPLTWTRKFLEYAAPRLNILTFDRYYQQRASFFSQRSSASGHLAPGPSTMPT